MSKEKFSNAIKGLTKGLKKHSPEILTGIGIAGMIGAVVMAVKATPKAVELLENKKDELNVEKLSPVETVKTTWKCYIPTAVTGILGAACIIGASSVNHKRNAALAAAYGLTETAFKEYKDKVVEVIGEKKEQTVKDEIAKDKLTANPVTEVESTAIVTTGYGDTLCYETLSGRYFYSDIEKIRAAENRANKTMLQFDYISLNEFYDELDLGHTGIGDSIGWGVAHTGLINLNFSSQLTNNSTPCLVIGYDNIPVYNFDD